MKSVIRILTSLVGLLAATFTLHGAAPAKPNIIFILVDDLGMPAVGCYGGAYKTPNIDKLAAGGIRFERCFSAPLCAPSRALCMMGRYGFRTGVVDNPFGGRATPDKEICVAKPLKNAGYATAVVGKWRQLPKLSTKAEAAVWGWDEFLLWGTGDGEGGDRYWSREYLNNGKEVTIPQDKYGPDYLQDYVMEFIRRHRDQPFFIYYPMTMIHGGFKPTPDTAPGVSDRAHLYTDTITYMDKLIGKLMFALDEMHLREKTLVIFTGDNGSVDPQTIHGRLVDGVKHQLNEGGSRVPLIANWPGTTPAGKVLDDLVDFTDFYVTFAEVAGAKLPVGHKLDGHSFAPQLRGEKGNPREWVFMQLADRWYARSSGWKLYNDGQLFDMSDAPFSEKLVPAGSESEAAKAARKKLQAVLTELNPGVFKAAPKFEHESPKAAGAPKGKKKPATN
jgi:arylsulfatase A